MKNVVVLCLLFLVSCSKDKRVFTFKEVKLNTYEKGNLPTQKLFIKFYQIDGDKILLGQTDTYPSDQTLPAVFGIEPNAKLLLYKNHYSFELWGDSTGLIGYSNIDMKKYKITYQLEMETNNEGTSFTIIGDWK